MPRPFPKEFREDVVRVARSREPGQTIKKSAFDFDVNESCLTNWLTAADPEDGVKPGVTVDRPTSTAGSSTKYVSEPTGADSVAEQLHFEVGGKGSVSPLRA